MDGGSSSKQTNIVESAGCQKSASPLQLSKQEGNIKTGQEPSAESTSSHSHGSLCEKTTIIEKGAASADSKKRRNVEQENKEIKYTESEIRKPSTTPPQANTSLPRSEVEELTEAFGEFPKPRIKRSFVVKFVFSKEFQNLKNLGTCMGQNVERMCEKTHTISGTVAYQCGHGYSSTGNFLTWWASLALHVADWNYLPVNSVNALCCPLVNSLIGQISCTMLNLLCMKETKVADFIDLLNSAFSIYLKEKPPFCLTCLKK